MLASFGYLTLSRCCGPRKFNFLIFPVGRRDPSRKRPPARREAKGPGGKIFRVSATDSALLQELIKYGQNSGLRAQRSTAKLFIFQAALVWVPHGFTAWGNKRT